MNFEKYRYDWNTGYLVYNNLSDDYYVIKSNNTNANELITEVLNGE